MCVRSARVDISEAANIEATKAQASWFVKAKKAKEHGAKNVLRVYTLSGKIIELNGVDFLQRLQVQLHT